MKQDVPVHGGLLKRTSNTLRTLQDFATRIFKAPVKCGANHSAPPSEMARPLRGVPRTGRGPLRLGRGCKRACRRAALAAAKLAGLKEVTVVVRKLDNEQALAVTIAENLLRKDLHPLEKAEAIQLAFDREYDLKAIASRLGKSVGYLARRASLTRLSKAWRAEVMKAESDASRLSAAHLELVARLPEATQDSLADDHFWPIFGRGFPTVKELRQIVDGCLRSLGAMPWDPADETIDPKAGSCVNCQKRPSQSRRAGTKDDRCLDPACFDRKHVAFVQRCECKHRTQHPNLRLVEIGVATSSPAIQEAFGDRIESRRAGIRPETG